MCVGHTTVMADVQFFGEPANSQLPQEAALYEMLQRLNDLSLGGGGRGMRAASNYLLIIACSVLRFTQQLGCLLFARTRQLLSVH